MISEKPNSGDEIRITATKGTLRKGDVLIVASSWSYEDKILVRALMKGRKSLTLIKSWIYEWEIINHFEN